ncbi:deoxyguanosinetriphosphate triphosphohydrolase [Anaerovorax odorimutans]|uniref:Deoxyguanosinetriphosphate triphosphohydrolase n=1 Tax=Anaerovorax odorimutans TaxID=109327 RepID=A0ABT1RP14_9FIRM|nr:deoxyguanosinetriphosphate triphosphohydrolase [Anaerovorax odorimutans]MCQ4636920.1 deoxyguanosinetriphosphate triphosphohydrolase [Anaerovorax odorimutans]
MDWSNLLCPERIRSYRSGAGSGDLRTEFEKDYHRIINSASFRRLQDKTQVFPLDKSDFIRTRLTHSLEVSSFGKSLGQNISEQILRNIGDETFQPSYKADICDILQCAGLLHDIGNPPFGHFGETAIRQWFRENLPRLQFQGMPISRLLSPQMREDFYNFEGNTQALRLVTKLHFLVDEHGMNLTKALLGTMIKYPVSSLGINKYSGNIKDKKMGYYHAEEDLFLDLQESLGTGGNRHPLTFILEAADDIAYKTADIEDACKKGCISYERLIMELENRAPEGDEEYGEMVESLKRRYQKARQRGISSPELNAVQTWIVYLQGRLIACATFGFTRNYQSIMKGSYKKDLFAGTYGEAMMQALGDIAFDYAFNTEPILKLEIAAQTIFNFLLDKFVSAAVYYDTPETQSDVSKKLMALISDNYKGIYHIYAKDKGPVEKLYLRLLLVTDFICGMTDSYAKTLYQELNGIV